MLHALFLQFDWTAYPSRLARVTPATIYLYTPEDPPGPAKGWAVVKRLASAPHILYSSKVTPQTDRARGTDKPVLLRSKYVRISTATPPCPPPPLVGFAHLRMTSPPCPLLHALYPRLALGSSPSEAVQP